MEKSSFLVIGGGLAGLSFALRMAKYGTIHLLLKEGFNQSSTHLAQGGINAVLGKDDSFESHIKDTLNCGYELCDEDIVELIVKNGPDAIKDLAHYGIKFTKNGNLYDLHKEGGHTHKRVVHSQDATGIEIMRGLVEAVKKEPNIQLFFHHMAIDLIISYSHGLRTIKKNSRAIGAYVLNAKINEVMPFLASVTYIATGGIGKVYPYTSNANTATGDGITMAYRCGIQVANMEFIQFHPTLLFHPKIKSFLISEAVRGEGGILRNQAGEAFMKKYHSKLKDLAPRDIVARAIDTEIKKSGLECVFLDLTHLPASEVIHHFPNIYDKLRAVGLDITKEYIPVVPGAHYLCGGLKVNIDGQTDCKSLFSGGECTFTGFHGANRLASNSLLEAVVQAKRSANLIQTNLDYYLTTPPTNVSVWYYHNYADENEESLIHPLWQEVREFMWNYVGIVRTNKRLERAFRRIESLRKEIEDSYWNFRISKDLVELRNISIIAELVIRSAKYRKESRGLHFNADIPKQNLTYKKNTWMSISKQGLFR